MEEHLELLLHLRFSSYMVVVVRHPMDPERCLRSVALVQTISCLAALKKTIMKNVRENFYTLLDRTIKLARYRTVYRGQQSPNTEQPHVPPTKKYGLFR